MYIYMHVIMYRNVFSNMRFPVLNNAYLFFFTHILLLFNRLCKNYTTRVRSSFTKFSLCKILPDITLNRLSLLLTYYFLCIDVTGVYKKLLVITMYTKYCALDQFALS